MYAQAYHNNNTVSKFMNKSEIVLVPINKHRCNHCFK